MISHQTELEGVQLLEPKVFGDDRGYFLESWNENTFSALGIDARFVQDNHSRSRKGTLRGLHFQNPLPQGKLAWVVEGEVYDVVVDLRRASRTFGKWEAFTLNERNKFRLWVPPGFAHGFYVTSETVQFLYKCTEFYSPGHEHTLAWNDPALGIPWPIPPGETPLISEKDLRGSPLSECKSFE